jgi:protoporphyrinogen/coproporphyrinogen III oxidase
MTVSRLQRLEARPAPRTDTPARVIVVGAGIAGLTAAFRLAEAGLDVRVLEAGDRVGGRVSTVDRDGYRIDNGASLLTSAYAQMVKLIRDAGLDRDVKPTDSSFGILRDGVVHAMSSDTKLRALRTQLFSARAKSRLAPLVVDVVRARKLLDYRDFTRAAPLDTEPLRAYAERRARNREVLEYLVEPLSVAFFGGRVDEVSRVGFMFVLKNFVFGGSFFNSDTGMDFLPEGLARGRDVTLGAKVRLVEETAGGVHVTWDDTSDGTASVEEADAAVIAVPARAMLGIYPQLDGARYEIVQRIDYSRCITVAFGLAEPPTAPCSMLLVPPREHPDIFAVMFEHRKAPGWAPAGKGLVSIYCSRQWSDAHWDLDDEALAAKTRSAVSAVIPGLVDSAELSHVSRWDPFLAAGRVGLYRDLAVLAGETGRQSRVHLAGDYLGFSTTGGSVSSGEAAAARVTHLMRVGGGG